MADERVLFRGNPSPVTVFGSLVLSVLLFIAITAGLIYFWKDLPPNNIRYASLALFLIPLFILLQKWILLKFNIYEITSERVKLTTGILSKRTDELELYRVKDTSLVEPFLYRMFSVGNIQIVTNDATTPLIELRGIKHAGQVREQLRKSIEDCRVRKGARVVEME